MTGKNLLQAIRLFFRDHWIDFVIPLTTVTSIIAAITFTDEILTWVSGVEDRNADYNRSATFWSCLILGISVVLFIVASVFNVLRGNKLSQLEFKVGELTDQRDEFSYHLRAIVTSYMRLLSEDLDMKSTDRLSVYSHDDGAESFIMFDRFCPNPIFQKKGARFYYKDNQGYIAEAWKRGEFFIKNLPDFATHRNDYVKAAKVYNFPITLHTNIRMKSRLYYARKVTSLDHIREPLGVLLLESELPERWSKEDLDLLFERDLKKFCSAFQLARKTLPEISDNAHLGL